MKKRHWIKLIKLYIKLSFLSYRGEEIREPFNAMMRRKRERYSFLLGLENNSQESKLNPEQIKKEIKQLEGFIDFYSEALSFWDSSVVQIDDIFQRLNLENVLEIEGKKGRRAFLDQFPYMKVVLRAITPTLKQLLELQREIIFKLEGSVKYDKKERQITDSTLINLN